MLETWKDSNNQTNLGPLFVLFQRRKNLFKFQNMLHVLYSFQKLERAAFDKSSKNAAP